MCHHTFQTVPDVDPVNVVSALALGFLHPNPLHVPRHNSALQDVGEDSLLAKASPDLVLLALEMERASCRGGEGSEDSAIQRLPLLGQR